MPKKRAAVPPTPKTATKAVAKRRATRRGPAGPRGPEPGDSALALDHPDIAPLEARIRAGGGAALAAYRDPYAGSAVILASLPLGAIEPTPFQRDLSRVHADRLSVAIGAVGIFLDPVIAVPTRAPFRAWGPVAGTRRATTRPCLVISTS